MLPDRVSNPGPLTYESGALPIALRGPATKNVLVLVNLTSYFFPSRCWNLYLKLRGNRCKNFVTTDEAMFYLDGSYGRRASFFI